MVSIIKNQLLKHLSRFTKNLSADKINLSTFKGEGELTNLELDEIVLTELLELPSWLRLTNAFCNKVTFRIQWTKLKSVPIQLNLDEVQIEVETCPELRSTSAHAGLSSYLGNPGKYSYVHKIIDGITIVVNTVSITFRSPAFVASVQMSRIVVDSVSPTFSRSDMKDLRITRLKDTEKGQILIFKELVWQTVRIEAKSTKDPNLTPLRLLTNQARCRITIKKRLSDCLVLGSRLVLILDDLLWVLTDSQLKAALLFLDSLAGLVQKAADITRKVQAARKLEVLPEYQAQMPQQTRNKEPTTMSKIFARYDIIETSCHIVLQRIDLHLCDDPGEGRSSHQNLKDGGALQVTVQNLQVDYYPYHLAIGDRKHWAKYRDTNSPHTQWLEQSLTDFRNSFMNLIDSGRQQHTPLARSQPVLQQNLNSNSSGETGGATTNSPQENKRSPNSQASGNPIKNYVLNELAKLMTSCLILRINDFTLYKVSTMKKQTPKEFIAGDRDRYALPDEMSIVHAEFTYYYYPGETPFPLPTPKFYVQLNPVQVIFDVDSCLWANSFATNLYQSFLSAKSELPKSTLLDIEVKIEAIMPRIIFESTTDHPNQRDRPKSLHIQISRALITNVRSAEQSKRADLAKCIDTYNIGSLFFGTDFPSLPTDYYVVTDKFLKHIAAADNVREAPGNFNCNSTYEFVKQLNRELFWTEAKDVWCIHLEPVWADFFGTRAVESNRPIPFLDAFPLTLWVHMQPGSKKYLSRLSTETSAADIHCLAYISNLVSLQINHYQVLFLLRLSEELSELTTFMALDKNRILKDDEGGSLVIGAMIPQVEVSLVMPSQCPGKESSGGDLESVLPDSSSIGDDLGSTFWQSSMLHMDSTESRKVNFGNTESISTEALDAEIVTQCGISTIKSSNGPVSIKNLSSTQAFANINISKDLNAGISSMKKGLSNFMTSTFKPGVDDASDTMSVRSDISSDSENFVVVNSMAEASIDAMFRVTESSQFKVSAVEVASEVIEEENSATTPSEHSLESSYKRRDIISMATFKLGKLEFIQQTRGLCSSIKLQVSNVKCTECSSIPWDEFQNKFSSRSRAWNDELIDSGIMPCVKIRLNHEMQQVDPRKMDLHEKMSFKQLFSNFVEVRVNNIALDLNMTTITGLVDLMEDEVIQEPMPIQIHLQNILLNLIEDRLPSNITSPGAIPMNIKISELHINRDSTGLIKIEPTLSGSKDSKSTTVGAEDTRKELQSLQTLTRELKLDNDELKRRLAVYEQVSEENRILRKSQEELIALKSYITTAQNNVSHLLDEKKTLLDRIRFLEDELSYREVPSKSWSSKR